MFDARLWRPPTIVTATVLAFLAISTSARADVISTSPLPVVLGVPYSSSTAGHCFPSAGYCVKLGSLTFDSLAAAPRYGSPPVLPDIGEDFTLNVTYNGTLTYLDGTVVGPMTLTGTIDETFVGRTFDAETGSFNVDVNAINLSGPLNGNTVTLSLDDSPFDESTGSTVVTPLPDATFDIASFFDVFVDVDLDTNTPLHARLGPIHLSMSDSQTVSTIPEISSLAVLLGALASLLALRIPVAAIRRPGSRDRIPEGITSVVR
jgi:hypothetical protein